MLFTNSSKTVQCSKEVKNQRRGWTVFPGFLVFVDCTEQPIPRPKNKKRKRLYYSGKKKKHIVKNLYAANQNGLIIHKSKHRQRGRKHDYKVYKDNHPELPEDVMGMYDLGFLGVKKDYPEQKSSLPIKKEKGCDLTAQEKE